MPRPLGPRRPAKPSTPPQHARVARMVRAARTQIARTGVDGFQMGDVAKDAGVSLSTLYRYFPSRAALFNGVMHEQVGQMQDLLPPRPSGGQVEAVTDLFVDAGRQMLAAPELSREMIASHMVLVTDPDSQVTVAFKELICAAVGVEQPDEQEEQVLRLLEQVWFGILLSCLNGVLSAEQAETDTRLAVRLLASHVWD